MYGCNFLQISCKSMDVRFVAGPSANCFSRCSDVRADLRSATPASSRRSGDSLELLSAGRRESSLATRSLTSVSRVGLASSGGDVQQPNITSHECVLVSVSFQR